MGKERIIKHISLSVLLLWNIAQFLPYKKVIKENKWCTKDKPFICAHRGGASLNPENTEMAFDYIIKETSFTDMIETDIQTTKDGVIVLSHDKSISKQTLSKDELTISEHTYEELSSYNLGASFTDCNGNKPYLDLTEEEAKEKKLTLMKFEDFLYKYQNVRDFRMILEFKENGKKGRKTADKVLSMLNLEEFSWWKDRIMMMSFSDDLTSYLMEKDPSLYVCGLGKMSYFQQGLSLIGLGQTCNYRFQCLQAIGEIDYSNMKFSFAAKSIVDDAHKKNQAIAFWTVNDKEYMKIISSYHPDIITTDCPDLLYEVLNG